MVEAVPIKTSRLKRVRKNLRYAMTLAWAASPRLLIRYSLLGMFNAIMPPLSVYLGAVLVNKIAAAHLHPMKFEDVLYIVVGLWITFVVQRAVGAYMGSGRNLYVRRVELEAERRLLEKASKVDLGHFDKQQPTPNGSRDYWAKRIFASTPSQSNSKHTSENRSLIRRASYAAASVLVTQDDTGRKLNTSYLLRVLATTAAHSAAARSAYVPYWRRPQSRPASDFGSTIGNDAGMKVFHEFKPGILQLLKSHEPKFVSSIEERIGNK